MARVYVSFLGTNDYVRCTYVHGEYEAKNVRFVQEATIGMFCRGWSDEDRILIFTTEDAYKRNWENNGHKKKSRKPIRRKGLRSCIQAMHLPLSPYRITIPEGKNQEEIWEIFNLVFENLGEGDEVVFDITHAFRSIPMLAVVILNYARVMKKVRLRGIYYGAFEALGSPDAVKKMHLRKRIAQVLDLTPLILLMDWAIGVDRFVNAGDAALLSELAEKFVRPFLSESKGQDKVAKTINSIAKNLRQFTMAVSTCRSRGIEEITGKLKRALENYENVELVKPFKPVFNQIKKQITSFPDDTFRNGIQAARWCLDHNLIQQGFTILNEVFITHIISRLNRDMTDRDTRELVSQAIRIQQSGMPMEEWYEPARNNPHVVNEIGQLLGGHPDIMEAFEEVRSQRNDLNHAGNIKGPQNAAKFNAKLKRSIERFERYAVQLSIP